MKRKIVALFVFTVGSAMHNAAIGMDYPGMESDYPQLQLQEPEKKSIKRAEAILKLITPAAYSLALSFNPNLQVCFPGKPMRYLGDPVIGTQLLLKDDSEISYFDIGMPAKQLFNLDNKSVIQLYIFNKKNPQDSRFINATCQSNPEIEPKNGTFLQQFENTMTSFYEHPNTPDHTHNAKLLAEKVIIEKIVIEGHHMGNGFFSTAGRMLIEHGEKGCPNEQAFIKSIIKPKIKPYGNTPHHLIIMQRQLGIKPRPALTTDPDRILDNCLRVMELEVMAENNTLDECFRELQINCLLTQLFIKNRITKLFIQFLAQK